MTTTVIDVGGEKLALWVAATGHEVARLSPQPAPIMLARALSGFLAIGRASMLLLTTTTDPEHIRIHDLAYEITANAEMWLTETVGDTLTSRYTDRGDHLHPFISDPALTAAARTRLQQTAHSTAAATRDLLARISADPSVQPALRHLARDMGSGADTIAKLYDDDPRNRHHVDEIMGWARDELSHLRHDNHAHPMQ
jgi:hypothetical protein